jgi:hypothetical protein
VVRSYSLSLSEEVSPTRGLGRGFTQRGPLLPECRNKQAGVLLLNLSRRDRNRADLSLDK